jgi:hypothetical protein
VGRGTLESLTKRGFITPLGKYDSPAHDDYALTPFGQQWAVDSEGDFLAQLEQRINQEADRKVLPDPDVIARSRMPEPEVIERSSRRKTTEKPRTKI